MKLFNILNNLKYRISRKYVTKSKMCLKKGLMFDEQPKIKYKIKKIRL